ncbi:MAG: phenylalanine 4-monooxygenase [Legionella sp.]|nr:MAG: phenylalanine 4-monooxygenase [Legionella sp.]
MNFISRYQAHQSNASGRIDYSSEEHHVWQQLFSRQKKILPGRAADDYLAGLDALQLTEDCIPQLPDINRRLSVLTGWEVMPVAALISARAFFELLAARRFPAATFIRVQEELDYVKEPDIFHELFGHCPMLVDPVYADFVQAYAQLVLTLPETDWPLLQRLFWYTVEFGLIQTSHGLRIYGGGILSSVTETVYCVESHVPLRILFDPLVAFRTPYRIDQLQSTYFVIEDYQQLYAMVKADLKPIVHQARMLGEFPPLFATEDHNPNIHIHAC